MKQRELFSAVEKSTATQDVSNLRLRFEELRASVVQLITDNDQVQFLDQYLWSFKYQIDMAKGDLVQAGFKLETKMLEASEVLPTPIWTEQGTLGKSLVLWKGQLFVEGHFRSMAFSANFRGPGKAATIENTISVQLWGAWNSILKKFEFKTKGAQAELLQKFYTSHILYRGMKDFEFSVLQALAHLYRSDFTEKRSIIVKYLKTFKDKAKLSETDKNYFETVLNKIESHSLNKLDCIHLADEVLSFVYNDQSAHRILPLFTSPNLKIGQKWAKPDIAQFEVSQIELIKLSNNGELYAGVEDTDLEIGFYSLRSWKFLIHSILLVE